MRSGSTKQRRCIAAFALAFSTVALAACSGGDTGYSPAAYPAGEPVPQSQGASGVNPDQPQIQQGVPEQEGAPPQDPGALGGPIPGEPVPGQTTTPESAIPNGAPRQQSVASSSASASSPHCATESLPGTYTTILAQGRITGSTFTAATGSSASVWDRSTYVAAKHATPKPSSAPVRQPVLVYTGTYTVNGAGAKVDTTGCVTLIAAQNGANFKASKFSARSTGAPAFAKATTSKLIASGSVTKLTITGLSKAGGAGTFVLSNKFTGTIRLTSRTTLP